MRHEILVVIFCGIKRQERREFGHDWRSIHVVAFELRDVRLRFVALLRCGVKNLGTVLRSVVGALTIQLRRIVCDAKIDLQQLRKRDLFGVVGNFDRFSMAGRTGAHHVVVGRRRAAAGVSGNNLRNTAKLIEDGLHSPKTATRQDDVLKREKDGYVEHSHASRTHEAGVRIKGRGVVPNRRRWQ